MIFKMAPSGIKYGSRLFKAPYAKYRCSPSLPVIGDKDMVDLGRDDGFACLTICS